MLTRHEMNVRKLLTKYHDDPEVIKRNRNVALFNFDPRRAERTRSKPYVAMTKEEREWSSIDKVLHPEVPPLLLCVVLTSLRCGRTITTTTMPRRGWTSKARTPSSVTTAKGR
jgi:hypothetical protein